MGSPAAAPLPADARLDEETVMNKPAFENPSPDPSALLPSRVAEEAREVLEDLGEHFFNPALSVRGPKHVVTQGKTPVLEGEVARRLIESIPIIKIVKKEDGTKEEVPDVVGLRDRALLGLMVYSFARVSAVVAMEVKDYS